MYLLVLVQLKQYQTFSSMVLLTDEIWETYVYRYICFSNYVSKLEFIHLGKVQENKMCVMCVCVCCLCVYVSVC